MPDRPEIVCICGSARFIEEMREVDRQLTLAGVIVVAPTEVPGDITDEQKALLGELHFRKIDLADRIVVVNPGGYIGGLTSREIEYARAAGKPVAFTDPSDGLSSMGQPRGALRSVSPRVDSTKPAWRSARPTAVP